MAKAKTKKKEEYKLPHGAIHCPHCSSLACGMLDRIYCESCGKPYWPMELILKQTQKLMEEAFSKRFDQPT